MGFFFGFFCYNAVVGSVNEIYFYVCNGNELWSFLLEFILFWKDNCHYFLFQTPGTLFWAIVIWCSFSYSHVILDVFYFVYSEFPDIIWYGCAVCIFFVVEWYFAWLTSLFPRTFYYSCVSFGTYRNFVYEVIS